MTWKKFQTCSRVSGGPCADCKRETFFEHYSRRAPREVLCVECYEKRYDPEAVRARARDREDAARDREERRVFAREEVRRRAAGLPPVEGWHREGSLIVNDTTGEKRGFF